jgi:steroid delta-isomerase-like uncharacterized protein
MSQDSLLQLLGEFAEAWNRHDCEALLALVTDDCVFETSSGQHAYGDRHAGKNALRTAFPKIWELYPDASWRDATHVVCGTRGFSEWTFHGTGRDGRPVIVRGVDIFTFRGCNICRKDTYRKNVIS